MLLSYNEEKELADDYYAEKISKDYPNLTSVPVKEIIEDIQAGGEFVQKAKEKLALLNELSSDTTRIPTGMATMIRQRQDHRIRFVVMKPAHMSNARAEIARRINDDYESTIAVLDSVASAFEVYLGHDSNQVVIDNRDFNKRGALSSKWMRSSERVVFVVPVLADQKTEQATLLLNTDKLERIAKQHKKHLQEFTEGKTDRYQLGDRDAEYELLAMCLLSSQLALKTMILAVNLLPSDKWDQFPVSFSTRLLPDTPQLPVKYVFTAEKRPTVYAGSKEIQLPYESDPSLHLPFRSLTSSLRMEGGENMQGINALTLGSIRSSYSYMTESKYGHAHKSKTAVGSSYMTESKYGHGHKQTTAVGSSYYGHSYGHKQKHTTGAGSRSSYGNHYHQHAKGQTSCKHCKGSFFTGCRYCGGGDDDD